MVKKILIGVLIGIIVGVGWWGFSNREEIIYPLIEKKIEKKQRKMKVVGFLPTWMVGKTIEYKNEVDEVIFLGIEVDGEGKLVWDEQSKKIFNDNYLKLKKGVRESGGKNVLGFKLFHDEKLMKLFEDEIALENLILEIRETVDNNEFEGINIDFEWQGNMFAVYDPVFLNFVERLRKESGKEVSVDVFANTIIKGDVENIKKLVDTVDSVIVMGYDFHTSGSNSAGAVAPMKNENGERNIFEIGEKLVVVPIDRKKIVMAFPLYGYEWKTVDQNIDSEVINYEGMWMMSKLNVASSSSLLEERDFKVNFDEVSMTPWIGYKKDEQVKKTIWLTKKRKKTVWETVERNYQIWYEDWRSIKVKIEWAKEIGVGGVGFWALGYEGKDMNFWKMMDEILKDT